MEEKEIWKDVVGYEGLYQVSNLGRVKHLYCVVITHSGLTRTINERVVKPRLQKTGTL